jgi:hypothetical protein
MGLFRRDSQDEVEGEMTMSFSVGLLKMKGIAGEDRPAASLPDAPPHAFFW